MPIQTRKPFKLKSPGPYLAIVKNHADPGYMGGLEVSLIKGFAEDGSSVAGQLVAVQYLTPFYGSTSVQYEGPDAKAFNDAQKSYGMWMVPPDIGTTVMVIFIEGDSNQGYWIGCIQDRYQNHMIPGLGGQYLDNTWLTPDQVQKYGANYLPVAEMNKQATAKLPKGSTNVNTINKPVHIFADALAEQGLLADTTRGVTSSSARRETPSMVFGISTPGPLDKTGKKGKITYGARSATVPVSRLGGTTFVMDDGDEDGNNELVRIRTRTGHQILLHNTADLIYIANAKGTAWIEMTGNGKIDIYAEDSISMHTEADFNLRAGRNFNIEGRAVNIKSFGEMKTDVNSLSTLVKTDAVITTMGTLSVSSAGDLSLRTNADLMATALKKAHVRANTKINLTGGDVDIMGSGTLKLSGGKVKLQAPDPELATPAVFEQANPFAIVSAPYVAGGVSTTMHTFLQRVPTHEPWPQHENNDPVKYSADQTDVYNAGTTTDTPNAQVAMDALPDTDAIVFTSGSGDAAHFAKATVELQNAVKQAATAFKTKTGRPVIITSSFRSYSEQKALYDRWIAAGGGPNNPKAGGIYTPVNPDAGKPSNHARGIAFDSPNAPEMDKLGILTQYGLYRPVPVTDKVHVSLRAPGNQRPNE